MNKVDQWESWMMRKSIHEKVDLWESRLMRKLIDEKDEWRMMKNDEDWWRINEGLMKNDKEWWFQSVEGFTMG